jgi:tRNA-dihydrouridine synthase
VVVSGGLHDAPAALAAHRNSGAAAVMLARGALGNPWIFEEVLGIRARPPTAEEIVAEILWTVDRAEEHWGAERGCRNLRKLYPAYLARLGLHGAEADAFQRAESLASVREMLAAALEPVALAA